MSYPGAPRISSSCTDNRDLNKELDVLIGVFEAQGREKMASRLEKVRAGGNDYTKRIHIWIYKRFVPEGLSVQGPSGDELHG